MIFWGVGVGSLLALGHQQHSSQDPPSLNVQVMAPICLCPGLDLNLAPNISSLQSPSVIIPQSAQWERLVATPKLDPREVSPATECLAGSRSDVDEFRDGQTPYLGSYKNLCTEAVSGRQQGIFVLFSSHPRFLACDPEERQEGENCHRK